MYHKIFITIVALLSFSANHLAHATEFVYPSKGQSEEQQNKDKWQCHQWATTQTGVDPEKMLQQTHQPQTSSGEEPIGLIRRLRMRKQLKEQQKFMDQQLAADKQRMKSYDAAYGTCLKGRGYSVSQ